MKPTFGSLFAGVGGFDLGFEAAGYECRFQVEWDTHCQQTLAYHWPDIPRWGDVSEVNGADLPPVDVITYGFPCQDLSVAGKRAGLDGNRSGLFFQAVRIITEMREATNGRYPTWAVAENVAGLLNADNGHAMGRCVDELAKAGSLVIEWCLVDAQWFGVPQRRRRVFLASCFDPATADRCPDPVFPVAPSGTRNPASSQQEREHTATTPSESTRGNSSEVDQTAFRMLAFGQYSDDDSASTIKSRDHKDHTDLIVPFVKAKRAQTDSDNETWEPDPPNPTLNEFDTGDSRTTTAIVFTAQRVGEEPRIYTDATPALLSRMGTGGNNTPMVAQQTDSEQPTEVEQLPTDEVIGPLLSRASKGPNSDDVRDGHLIPIAFSDTQGLDPQASDHHFPTLRSEGGGQAVAQPLGFSAGDSYKAYGIGITENGTPPIRAGASGTNQSPTIMTPELAVRRLTPLECERLMGWPDNHTLHRTDGKQNSDSTRYRMCENGIVKPVAQWIAKHLANTLQ